MVTSVPDAEAVTVTLRLRVDSIVKQLIRAFRLMYLSRRLTIARSAEAPEPHLFPGQRSRARSSTNRGRHGAPARLRLVLPLLSRPRTRPDSGRHRRRNAAAGSRSGTRPERPADARCRRTGLAGSCTSLPDRRRQARNFVQSVGCANATQLLCIRTATRSRWYATGEGATSEGEFWECMNHRLPRAAAAAVPGRGQWVRHLTPVERQTPGGSISAPASTGFPGLLRLEVDGTDFVASWAAMSDAVAMLPRRARVRHWCMRM